MKKRIVDVEVNRASEGLRVVEDLLRFAFKNETLSMKAKNIRSRIRREFSGFEIYRKSEEDIGRKPDYDIKKNLGIKEVLLSNLKRSEEAMRVIEEVFSEKRETAKSIRFELYDFEKELSVGVLREFSPSLYLITPATMETGKLLKVLDEVLTEEIDVLQLRRKNITDRQFCEEAKEVAKMCRERGITFIVNDRVDIALISEADGVHLGDDDIKVEEVKKIFPELITGATAQTPERARKLELCGADYIGCGAVFHSKTKPERNVIGLEGLEEVVKSVSVPVVAIGGIKSDRVQDVLETGAVGVAVVDAVFGSPNPREEVRKFAEQIRKFKEQTEDFEYPIDRV